jgi:hypothetical protein
MDHVLARKLNLVSTICFIGLGGLPHERAVFAPAEDEQSGNGGGGGNEEKPAFTQKQVNDMLAKEKGKLTAAQAELKKELDEIRKSHAELKTHADELELKGKTAEEKARISADKAAKQIEADKAAALKERDDAKAIADAATKSLRAHVVGTQLSHALIAAKALPTSLKHAVPAFLADVEIDTDESNTVTAVRLGGVAQKDLAEAATAWLKTNSHFASHAGGGGTKGGAGGPAGGKPFSEWTQEERIAEGNRLRRENQNG